MNKTVTLFALFSLVCVLPPSGEADEPPKSRTPGDEWWDTLRESIVRENKKLSKYNCEIRATVDDLRPTNPPRRLTLLFGKGKVTKDSKEAIDTIKIDNICFVRCAETNFNCEINILDSFQHCIIVLEIHKCNLADGFFTNLQRFSLLNDITLESCSVSNSDLDRLASYPCDSLTISGNTIDGNNIKYLHGKVVRKLIIRDNCKIDDDAVMKLEGSTMSRLDISNTSVTSRCLQSILKIKSLETLCINSGVLSQTQKTDLKQKGIRVIEIRPAK